MIHTVSETLTGNGFEKSLIKYELSTVPETESAYRPEIKEGQAQISVTPDDDETFFMMNTKDRILDAVLQKDIDAPYFCQGGVCSSCIARVTKRKAEMVQNQILTDNEIAEGLIFSCQALAVSDEPEIDYDDVQGLIEFFIC